MNHSKTLLLAVFSLCACVTALPQDKPMRLISLAPSTTEILFALGLDKEIVGVSSFCDYPDNAALREKIGDFSSPNKEKIVSLRPDYIFCTGLEQAPVIEELRRLNLKVYVADPVNIHELLATINDIGNITGKTKEAHALIASIKNDIAQITARAARIPKKKKVTVFVEIWHDPLMTAGRGSFVDELITLAGGINVAGNTLRPYSNYNSEKVIRVNPQCIILTYMDKEPPLKLVESRYGWKNIAAVKNARVYSLQPEILLRPGPRVVIGMRELYKRFYPDNE